MRVSQATSDSGSVNAIRMAPMILPPMGIKIPIIALSVNRMARARVALKADVGVAGQARLVRCLKSDTRLRRLNAAC